MIHDDNADAVFKALGNSTRRGILDTLKNGPQTTGTLCQFFPEIDRCTVMQHLRVLEGANLVVSQRRGRERWNFLNAIPIQSIHDRWIGEYAAHAAQMISRLEHDLHPKKSAESRAKSGADTLS